MLTINEMRALARTPSRDQRRAEYMGWKFHDVDVLDGVGGVIIRGYFTCVCGAPEAFSFAISPIELMSARRGLIYRLFDVGLRLREFGSFSREHLLADGYSEAQVAEFERRGAEFDRANQ
jgi:hypothetical protein